MTKELSNSAIEMVKGERPAPAFDRNPEPNHQLRAMMIEMLDGWLQRTPSEHTRSSYRRDLQQFMDHAQIGADEPEQLVRQAIAAIGGMEKFVPKGGPSGGNGGKGGNILFEANQNLNTLLDFKYKRKYNYQIHRQHYFSYFHFLASNHFF